MSPLYRVFLSLSFAFSAMLLASCGSSPKTQVRALQASPNEPTTLNVLLDSSTLFSDIALGTPTSYASVTAGSHTLEVQPSNSSTDAITQSITLNSGDHYTVITANYAANLSSMILTDDTSAPSSGNFKIRVANAAVEASSVDVYILAAGSPNPSGGSVTPTISGLTFTSGSAYQSLPAGTYQIVVGPAGFPVVQYINIGSVSFTAGQNRTLVILPDGTGGITSVTLSDLN